MGDFGTRITNVVYMYQSARDISGYSYTNIIIIANVIAFILQLIIPRFFDFFALTPVMALNGAYWQFITYMFLHGGFWHIFINMFILSMFGALLEKSLGTRRFLILYLGSGFFSAVFYLLLSAELFIPMVGASGAIFAVITAFAFKYPNANVLMFFLFPLKVKYAVIILGIIELFLGVLDLQMGIANFGHLGGILAGFLIMLYWRRRDQSRKAHEFRDMEFFWE